MSKEQSYQNAASELLRLVGGEENVISAAHCATRLRLVLKDESKADVDGILKTELVKGQFSTGGQFQIIIGSGTAVSYTHLPDGNICRNRSGSCRQCQQVLLM